MTPTDPTPAKPFPAGSWPDRGADTYLGFVGVSTASSSIRTVFPRWADFLGLPTRTLRGHDIALGSPAQVYRDVVAEIKNDPRHWGALITTHKMAVFESAADQFDELDELALTFGEISCMTKRGGRLLGAAKDPVTARLALEEFLPEDHFGSTGAAALVLGSGGAGSALTHQLGTREDTPSEIICTAIHQRSLDSLRKLHERAGIDSHQVRYVLTSRPEEADELLAAVPEASLVVNATGMGKDLPGSPLTDAARFPVNAVVWEFNYRGPLEFLRQARAQESERGLRVEDGWRYFVHGWSQVIADVFDIAMPPQTVSELSRIAAEVRAPTGSRA